MVAIWSCKRTTYALDLKGAGPFRRTATLWALRFLRLPLMAICGLYVASRGGIKIAFETLTRSALVRS
jgi:hypothetical protein